MKSNVGYNRYVRVHIETVRLDLLGNVQDSIQGETFVFKHKLDYILHFSLKFEKI